MNLPDEILNLILEYLPRPCLQLCCLINKQFYQVAKKVLKNQSEDFDHCAFKWFGKSQATHITQWTIEPETRNKFEVFLEHWNSIFQNTKNLNKFRASLLTDEIPFYLRRKFWYLMFTGVGRENDPIFTAKSPEYFTKYD